MINGAIMGKKVTIRDISNELGLSSYTVSRALSGKPGVNENTRNIVFEASKALGYNRNSQLETNKNILLFIPKTDYKDSSFWMKMVHGIEYSASNNGYSLVIKFIDSDDLDSQINVSSNIAGIIYASNKSVRIWNTYKLELPSILMTYPPDNMMDIDIFYNSLYESAFAISDKLIAWGHRDFAFYGTLNRASSIYTLEGMKNTLKKNDLEFKYLWTTPDEVKMSFMVDKLTELKKKEKLPTAILCVNDNLAVSMVYILSQLGISVPHMVSVTGCNGDINNDQDLPITSAGNDNQELGKMAFDFLLERINKPNMPYRRLTIEPKLFIRDTAGPARKNR